MGVVEDRCGERLIDLEREREFLESLFFLSLLSFADRKYLKVCKFKRVLIFEINVYYLLECISGRCECVI